MSMIYIRIEVQVFYVHLACSALCKAWLGLIMQLKRHLKLLFLSQRVTRFCAFSSSCTVCAHGDKAVVQVLVLGDKALLGSKVKYGMKQERAWGQEYNSMSVLPPSPQTPRSNRIRSCIPDEAQGQVPAPTIIAVGQVTYQQLSSIILLVLCSLCPAFIMTRHYPMRLSVKWSHDSYRCTKWSPAGLATVMTVTSDHQLC